MGTAISSTSLRLWAERPVAAERIDGDEAAIAKAESLAAEFARDAAERDRCRRLPAAEVERFSQSGLWAITIPRAYGGPGVSNVTLARVISTIAAADGSLGQIPQNHFFLVEALRWSGREEQKRRLFGRVVAGDRFGNALAERGTRTAFDLQTQLVRDGAQFRLSGRKYYCSGALFAHWIVPSALDDAGARCFVFLPRATPGITVVDDWAGFGQRTTASGTTTFDQVGVPEEAVVPAYPASGLTLSMPVAHIMHAAIDAGIARGALADMLEFVRQKARPWPSSRLATAAEDPHTIGRVGELAARLHAAEAMIERSGRLIDDAARMLDEDSWTAAMVAVSEAKILAAEVAIGVSDQLIELGGASATAAEYNLDRHWRNARTHTVHDPIRWRRHEVGDYWLNGVSPPMRHDQPAREEAEFGGASGRR